MIVVAIISSVTMIEIMIRADQDFRRFGLLSCPWSTSYEQYAFFGDAGRG